jgi:hypothetical protein
VSLCSAVSRCEGVFVYFTRNALCVSSCSNLPLSHFLFNPHRYSFFLSLSPPPFRLLSLTLSLSVSLYSWVLPWGWARGPAVCQLSPGRPRSEVLIVAAERTTRLWTKTFCHMSRRRRYDSTPPSPVGHTTTVPSFSRRRVVNIYQRYWTTGS